MLAILIKEISYVRDRGLETEHEVFVPAETTIYVDTQKMIAFIFETEDHVCIEKFEYVIAA